MTFPFSFWRTTGGGAPAPTEIRMELDASTLTGSGSAEIWVDQDTTDGVANNQTLDWVNAGTTTGYPPPAIVSSHIQGANGSMYGFNPYQEPFQDIGVTGVEAWIDAAFVKNSGTTGDKIQLMTLVNDDYFFTLYLVIGALTISVVSQNTDGTTDYNGTPVVIPESTRNTYGLLIEANGATADVKMTVGGAVVGTVNLPLPLTRVSNYSLVAGGGAAAGTLGNFYTIGLEIWGWRAYAPPLP